MGSLFIHLGQCGNQVGLQLWEYLRSKHTHSTDHYFYQTGSNVFAHSILVDTEPKVLKEVSENRKLYSYIDPKNVLYFDYGRGNNWALGYKDTKTAFRPQKKIITIKNPTTGYNNRIILKSPNKDESNINDQNFSSEMQYFKENAFIYENVQELVRKEIEKIDYYMGSYLMYSLAGGTGSGMGSRLLELLRDDYPKTYLITTPIFAVKTGETPLQHYNSLLSIHYMQTYSDSIIYFQNDKITKGLQKLSGSQIDKIVNINNINEYIASVLCSFLKLNDIKSFRRFTFDILAEASSLEYCKFLELYSSPFIFHGKSSVGAESSWEFALDACLSQVNIDLDEIENLKENKHQINEFNYNMIPKDRVNTSLNDVENSLVKSEIMMKMTQRKINQYFMPIEWNPDAIEYEYISDKPFKSLDVKQTTFLANRLNIANILKELAITAKQKFKYRAYLHWYTKYGLTDSDFEEAFNTIDNIIESYDCLIEN